MNNIKLSLLIFPLLTFCQAPNIEWQKSFGGSSQDYGICATNTLDGGYILSGQSTSVNGNVTGNYGNIDTWIAKVNSSGTLQWQKNYGGSDNDYNTCIRATTDGGYIFTAMTHSSDFDLTANKGNYDAWIVKLNSLGVIEWQKNCGGGALDTFWDVIQTNDGGYLASGYTHSNEMDVSGNHGNADCWVVKFDSSGTIVWQKCYGGSFHEQARKAIKLNDGNYLIISYSASIDGDITNPKGDRDYWVLKINSTGTIIWQKSYGGSGWDDASGAAELNDGSIVIVGNSQSSDGDRTVAYGYDDYWVLKIDAVGNLLWEKTFGGSMSESGLDIIGTSDGGCIVSGSIFSTDGNLQAMYGDYDIGLLRLNSSGDIVWTKAIGGNSIEDGKRLFRNSTGNLIAFGSSQSTNGNVSGNHGGNDYWLVKFQLENLSNTNFSLSDFKIVPNPTSSFLSISTEAITIEKIEVFDINGRLIISKNDNFSQIDVKNLESNIYLLKIYADKTTYYKKFIKY